MFIIELKNNIHKWIAGIFSSEQEGREFFVQISSKECSEKKLHTFSDFAYPFFILEDHEKFTFIKSETELLELIKNTPRVEDDEYCYFTLYICKEDFVPEQPGKDVMGILPHTHVVNEDMKAFDRGELGSYIEYHLGKKD